MKKKYYLVEEKEMVNLLDSYLHLLALEQGGVGDWEWYYESLGEFIDQHKLDHGIRYTIRDMAKEDLSNYSAVMLDLENLKTPRSISMELLN